MNRSESLTNLMPSLLAARAAIKPAGKSGKNTFDKYDYATELDWHEAVMPALLANGLAMSFSINSVVNLPDRTTKAGGTEHIVEVTGTVTLMHTSGEWIEVGIVGHGQDRSDKGVYKAMTGAKKYGYACLFSLPTTDDPERHDAQDSKPKRQPRKPQIQPQAQPEEQPEGYDKLMGEGLKYVAMITTCEDMNTFLTTFLAMSHVGTSRNDIWKAMVDKAKLIDCAYNKQTQQFEVKE